ncbi:MAG: PHP domain-containing protein [Candidatus Omnitrophica bacterium]|nr:PHP domain-containing protein [Candidatus Omnitrophota bacterium]
MKTTQPDKKCVDLHVHTIYSDGVFTPAEVVNKAIELGLRAVAITDHDCVDGVAPCIEYAKGKPLEVIPGVEITASRDDQTEIHILGYFVDHKNEQLLSQLRQIQENRVQRITQMVYLLEQHGVRLDVKKLIASVKLGTIGRPHLAKIMVEEGAVRNTREAFDLYIGDSKPCYVKHKRIDYRDAIKTIKFSGGVAVLAHPGAKGIDDYIPEYIAAGLRGIEVFHTKHRPNTSERYSALAKKHGLLITGGSDCHGGSDDEVLMGKVRVDYDVVEFLKKESEKR